MRKDTMSSFNLDPLAALRAKKKSFPPPKRLYLFFSFCQRGCFNVSLVLKLIIFCFI